MSSVPSTNPCRCVLAEIRPRGGGGSFFGPLISATENHSREWLPCLSAVSENLVCISVSRCLRRHGFFCFKSGVEQVALLVGYPVQWQSRKVLCVFSVPFRDMRCLPWNCFLISSPFFSEVRAQSHSREWPIIRSKKRR